MASPYFCCWKLHLLHGGLEFGSLRCLGTFTLYFEKPLSWGILISTLKFPRQESFCQQQPWLVHSWRSPSVRVSAAVLSGFKTVSPGRFTRRQNGFFLTLNLCDKSERSMEASSGKDSSPLWTQWVKLWLTAASKSKNGQLGVQRPGDLRTNDHFLCVLIVGSK